MQIGAMIILKLTKLEMEHNRGGGGRNVISSFFSSLKKPSVY